MKQFVVIINGKGKVGKDTLIDFVSERYCTINISSIDIIKQVASELGWDGTKNEKSRKFLSDMKKISSEYNNFPIRYVIDEYRRFKFSNEYIMFVHIREPEEIDKFITNLKEDKFFNNDTSIISLLITKDDIDNVVYGNNSDDNVENYDYDFIYNNNLPLDEAKEDFLKFFEDMLFTKYNTEEETIKK